MGFLDKLRERYADFTAMLPSKPPSATDAVPHDRFDEATWAEVREVTPSLNTMITELGETNDYVEDFLGDVFNYAVKGDPQIRAAEAMKASHRPNRDLLDSLAKLPEVQHLRSLTANDTYGAAMGVLSMQTRLREGLERTTEARKAREAQEAAEAQAREQAQAAEQALAEADAAEAGLAGLDEDADENTRSEAEQANQAGQEAAEAAVAAAEAALAAAQAADQAAEGATAKAMAGMRKGLREAAMQAAEERETEKELCRAFGVEDGELKRMPFAERAALVARLRNNRMARFLPLIGQFRQLEAAELRRRVAHVPDEIAGSTLGDDLTRLTSGELTNFALDELQDDFWMRWANRQLSVYKLEGREKLGQGPIIVVCDESGSMETADVMGGTREAWSKALTLALAERARKQGRDFTYIGFSSPGQQVRFDFPKGKGAVDQVIAMTEHYFDGGTHYEKPLDMALDVITDEYEAKGLPKPDIVFITDEDHPQNVSEAFMARWHETRRKTSLRCFGIAVCTGRVQGVMNTLCDDVRLVTAMTSDPHEVGSMFRMI